MNKEEMICKNCKYHYIEDISFDYPQSCCSKRQCTTEQWCKCYSFEYGDRYIEQLQKENEKLHHYKTLYQSLKRQKEELRDWLKEDKDKITVLDTKDNSSVRLGIMLGMGLCLEKLEELEGVSNE